MPATPLLGYGHEAMIHASESANRISYNITISHKLTKSQASLYRKTTMNEASMNHLCDIPPDLLDLTIRVVTYLLIHLMM